MTGSEARFPDRIGRRLITRPGRSTSLQPMDSGHEGRVARWEDARRSFDAAFGIRSLDDIQEVVAFFLAHGGRLRGFRFKDWSDFRSSVGPEAGPFDQPAGLGDGAQTQFQLIKLYQSGAHVWSRPITRPVEGSVRVAVSATELLAGWAVNTSTGVLTFAEPPAPGAEITAGFEFDVPVRFDSDALDLTLAHERGAMIASVPLVEIRT